MFWNNTPIHRYPSLVRALQNVQMSGGLGPNYHVWTFWSKTQFWTYLGLNLFPNSGPGLVEKVRLVICPNMVIRSRPPENWKQMITKGALLIHFQRTLNHFVILIFRQDINFFMNLTICNVCAIRPSSGPFCSTLKRGSSLIYSATWLNLPLVYFLYSLVEAIASYDTLSVSKNRRTMTSFFQVGNQKYTAGCLFMQQSHRQNVTLIVLV